MGNEEPVITERAKWVIIEVRKVNGKPTIFIAPSLLLIDPLWVGDIIWQVFTPDWHFDERDGVQFGFGTGFDGKPQPDPTRDKCWIAAMANTVPGTFNYRLHLRDDADGEIISSDPAVENEAPPPPIEPAKASAKATRPVATA